MPYIHDQLNMRPSVDSILELHPSQDGVTVRNPLWVEYTEKAYIPVTLPLMTTYDHYVTTKKGLVAK